MSKITVEVFPIDPRGPEDDPDEIDTPVTIRFPDSMIDRGLYEEMCDGYICLTEEEAEQLVEALQGRASTERFGIK